MRGDGEITRFRVAGHGGGSGAVMPRSQNEWREVIRGLRAKAADPVLTAEEAKLYSDKAKELETKYCTSTSPVTDDTTVTNRGTTWQTYDDFMAAFYGERGYYAAYMSSPQTAEYLNTEDKTSTIWEILRNLQRRQYQWNTEYYDRDGTPKRGYGGGDIVEDEYQDAPDDDEGYDMKEGDDW